MMRTLFWGMNGVFTWTILEALLEAGIAVVAVMIDSSAAPRTMTEEAFTPIKPPSAIDDELTLLPSSERYLQQNTINTAWRFTRPVYAVHHLNHADMLARVDAMDADVACVACYPKRLPSALLKLPKHGFLNIHPSLLPAYRGPAPLFWQLRDGVEPVGVTVHWMETRFDAGDIAAQDSRSLPDGIDGPGADRLLGETGSRLLVETLTAMGAGTVSRWPQPGGGSYQPSPMADDFRLDLEWTARRAFNFMRGTEEWGMPFSLVGDDGEQIQVRRALSFSPHKKLDAPYQKEDAQILIQFSPGVVTAVLA